MAKLRILRKSKKKKSADSPEGDADGAGRDASTRNSGYDNGDSPDLIPATPAPPHPVVMSSSHPSTAEAPSWDSSAEDFGQKVDLTARIREILRNYPEGLSILKELIQNADDAGARTVRLVAAEARHAVSSGVGGGRRVEPTNALSGLMSGPSLLAYNSAKFTETDFASIQRIGDSLKKTKSGTKTGRFGVGVNSAYHLTDVPMFVSGSRVVLFDPQASYVPGINPANPGKMVDCTKLSGRALVENLPAVFDPLRAFGCCLAGEDFDGTTFRFALRTEECAVMSRLSQRSHSLLDMKVLLRQMSEAAPSMLLFLKNVESIEIYDWAALSPQPVLRHRTSIADPTDDLRRRRSYVLNAPTQRPERPILVDYVMEIKSKGVDGEKEGENELTWPCLVETWLMCNQLGGNRATKMAGDKRWAHMRLVPWAGVAARLSPCPLNIGGEKKVSAIAHPDSIEVDVTGAMRAGDGVASGENSTVGDSGAAYCFLPLPIYTGLPVHVNGYFELSSNRRDVWWDAEDMTGDGRARAAWNGALVADIAGPCYCRLLSWAIQNSKVGPDMYEKLFPLGGSSGLSGPWRLLAERFYRGIHDLPVLYSAPASSEDVKGRWVSPASSVVLANETDASVMLIEILRREGLPLVTFGSPRLRETLIQKGVCGTTATPYFVRAHFRKRGIEENSCSALNDDSRRLAFASHLLEFCSSDLDASRFAQELSGCRFIALASGALGTFQKVPDANPDVLNQLSSMGFTRLSYLKALADASGDVDAAVEGLFQRRYENFGWEEGSGSQKLEQNGSAQRLPEVYLLCEGEATALLSSRAADSFVDLDGLTNGKLKVIYRAMAESSSLNIIQLEPNMLAEMVEMAIPKDWRGTGSSESTLWSFRPAVDNGEVAESEATVDALGNSDVEHPDEDWFRNLWRYAFSCPDPSAALSSIAAGRFCVVPTAQRLVCTLSSDAAVIDASGLDMPLVEVLVGLGVRTLSPGVLPNDVVIPKEFWEYVHRPNRDGVIKALGVALRQGGGFSTADSASDNLRKILYDYLRNASNGALSVASRAALRQFPIFRAHCDGSSEIQFVALICNDMWYALEGKDDHERSLMTSEFLVFDEATELEFLHLVADVTTLTRAQFYRRFVLPQIVDLDEDSRWVAAERILVDLSSLCASDPTFRNAAAATRIVPSAVTGTLKMPKELYDPEMLQLKALMEEDDFPSEKYCNRRFLPGLRDLGLQSSMSWDVVLDCARSIEREGNISEKNGTRESARIRGQQLMTFLDAKVSSYFPDLVPKEESRSSYFMRKVNMAIFEDAEKLKRDAELRARRVTALLSIGWMPVLTTPPNPLLPWPSDLSPVAPPLVTATKDRMWLVSYSRRLVDGDLRSDALKKLFGWLDQVSIEDVAMQLKMMGKMKFSIEGMDTNSLFRTVTSEVPRIYNILNGATSDYDANLIKDVLFNCAWLWMGDSFVPSDHVAFSSPINATPYLYTVPPDLACFRNLLSIFGVRRSFQSSDYAMVLKRMANGSRNSDKGTANSREIDLAVSLVQSLSDDVDKLHDIEIFGPSDSGKILPALAMTYDDAPWLSKDMPSKKDVIFCHPKLSAAVAQKIGAKSLRQSLVKNNAVAISFGEGNVLHGAEAFGQSESLTRRLKNIIEMYPEGPQQLGELVQNADDAQASIVRFVVSHRQHGTKSLIGQKLSAWQGPALLCYNDSKFSPKDFRNLASIGSASKLQRLATTGRFGLGFNSVFHWTDVPSLVSGDHLVMFDPHAKFVPGATTASRGMKIRFVNSSLKEQFPNQFEPYCMFGCDMKQRFEGTLFRFPFRTESTAAESEISKTQFGKEDAIDDLLCRFRDTLPKHLLFLRHVKRIEVYTETDSDPLRLLYFADVTERKNVADKIQDKELKPLGTQALTLRNLRSFTSSNASSRASVTEVNSNWNAVSDFVSGPHTNPLSKEDFYSRLQQTPVDQLPRTQHIVKIRFIDFSKNKRSRIPCVSIGETEQKESGHDAMFIDSAGQGKEILDAYLVCSGLGGGSCLRLACDGKNRDMKFLPWAGVAAHLTRNGNSPEPTTGNAFCFLPLPTETGLPVHINGYFELSANRRDIWQGEDMAGSGKVRSEWNRALLSDAIAPFYGELLLLASRILGQGNRFYQLWPVETKGDVWKIVQRRVYHTIQEMPLLHSSLKGGIWVSVVNSVLLDATNATLSSTRLMDIFLKENMNIVSIPAPIINALKKESCQSTEVTPSMARAWFKKNVPHPSLHQREDALFILKYCFSDLIDDSLFKELSGLPLIPLCNGKLGKFNDPSDFFVCNARELEILYGASECIVDVRTHDKHLNTLLKDAELHEQTNISCLDRQNFVSLLAHCYPPDWSQKSEVGWSPSLHDDKMFGVKSEIWLRKLWDYIIENPNDMDAFVESWQILPTVLSEGKRTLLKLSHDMGVLSLKSLDNGSDISDEVGCVLRLIGIRTLDTAVFDESNIQPILRQLLATFIQPPTVQGVVKALSNSFPPDIHNEDVLRLVALRFKEVSEESREILRLFLSDPRNIGDTNHQRLHDDCVSVLQALPIYQVYCLDRSDEVVYSDLVTEKFLPPTGVDPRILDNNFVKSSSMADAKFLNLVGVVRMKTSLFYENHICPNIGDGNIDDSTRELAIMRLLRDVPSLAEEEGGGSDWIKRISKILSLPNRVGILRPVTDLYDPTEADMMCLLDDSMLPSQVFCTGSTLSSLRMLGLRQKLNTDGVTSSARSIETSAASFAENVNQDAINSLRKRALALLNFLDKDETIVELLKSTEEEEIYPENLFIATLNEIAWLPVEYVCDRDTINAPPRKQRQGLLAKVGIASPRATRPKQDEWVCSGSMETLSTNVRSELLCRCFGWDKPVPIIVVASQIIELSRMNGSLLESRTFRQTLATVIPQCYERLNAHLESADEDERVRVAMLFHEQPWVWVGDRFVTSAQVAFDAPEHARPFLFSVPNELLCFDNLLKVCGVREKFSPFDFVRLSSSLSNRLCGQAATPKQIDLVVFISRHLSQLPPDELASVDKKSIYLPSKDGVMHRAIDMMYDDAPWLSAIVPDRTRAHYIFVHGYVNNKVAAILGAKSLRDVLSAHQNGMVKIPCPRSDALARHVAETRSQNSGCRVVLDLIEIAEMNGVKQVSISIDRRTHSSTSLLHPCLESAHGPALVVCFHGVALEVGELVKLTSPSKFYMSSVSGRGGCGGAGFPRYGSGLCGTFSLSDCLQILSGNSLMFFDPNGQHFVDGGSSRERKEEKSTENVNSHAVENNSDEVSVQNVSEGTISNARTSTQQGLKAAGRNYGISREFAHQFPDQFEPFFSLPFGVKEALTADNSEPTRFQGTVIRIPFRTVDSPPSNISKVTIDEAKISSLIKEMETLTSSLLFTYHVQSINVDEWPASESHSSPILRARMNSSPMARRNHLDELYINQDWKKSVNKFSKLFQSQWVAERSSYTMQLSHRHRNDENDIVDTYIIKTILAPPRLREMACTEALKPLNLIPAVSLAAHVHSIQGNKVLTTADFTPPKGTLFVGLDTGINTGLPFALNAPLFLHELTGDVMLKGDDDKNLKGMCTGMRNVTVGDEVKTLALHVWNRQSITSATKELISSMLKELRDPLQYMYSRDPRLLYRFWPYHSRVCERFQEVMPDSIYHQLATPESPIYLTDKDGFQTVNNGYFASQDYPFEDMATTFFQQKMPLFQVPRAVVQDLSRVGVDIRQLTPSMARRILKQVNHIQLLSHRPKQALVILEYCLSDMKDIDSFIEISSETSRYKDELDGLCLVPLSDGSVGSIGRQMIVASLEQQELLPSLKGKFICPTALGRLESFTEKPGFLDLLGLIKFGPQILASQISSVLPSSWAGKDFVTWDHSSDEGPTRLWIFQFWKEVSIWDYDVVQMFRRWPLIPMTSGELASCASAKFILSFCPSGGDVTLKDTLIAEYGALQENIDAKGKREAIRNAAESREKRDSKNNDSEFWVMGLDTEIASSSGTEGQSVLSEHEEIADVDSQNEEELYPDQNQEVPLLGEIENSSEESNNETSNAPDETLVSNSFLHEADGPNIMTLHQILKTIRCLLLEPSFFAREDILKILPPDRLSLSRMVLATLNHCTNYWIEFGSTPREQRLSWPRLSSMKYDQLLIFLTEGRGGRLSLMPSDLNALKVLPIFETLSGSRIALVEGNDYFTIDASIDVDNLNYLPESLRYRILTEKEELRDLLRDIGVQPLTEGKLLQKFVLPEFVGMPLAQKESVCDTILAQWSVLENDEGFVETMKATPFVKRVNSGTHSTEVVFVQALQLLDPRNPLFASVFDEDRSCFPAEEFQREEWLEILTKVGLKTVVDKDAFLACAWKVEAEQSVPKAMELLAYYHDHFGDYFDSSQGEFGRTLACIQCVPAEMHGAQLSLYKFCDVAVPKDRHVVFRVIPVLPESVCPPQIMFSTLGIVSPPTIATVLKHIRSLTEVSRSLDQWNYTHGTIDEVFCHIFSFLQENYDSLSPRVQEGLRGRPLVPVGTTLVKANRLFFRLTKDLAPFFYEVPRSFGACDQFLRNIGVRDSPQREDYAFSLAELKNDLGDGSLNINELKSVIDVITLVVDEVNHDGASLQRLYMPDARGKLVFNCDLRQNDCPWLVNSERLNLDLLRLAHPKLPRELCDKLGIELLSSSILEQLDGTQMIVNASDSKLDCIQANLQSDFFMRTLAQLVEQQHHGKIFNLRQSSVVRVTNLQTRIVFVKGRGIDGVNVTGKHVGSFCFIDDNRVLVSKLPVGLASELVVGAAICDYFRIDRNFAAGLSAMLASEESDISMIGQTMGIFATDENKERTRGDPGYTLVNTDLQLVELKPLKVFSKGETVAVKQGENLVYGVIIESGGGSSLSRLRVRVGRDEVHTMLSSELYCIATGNKTPSHANEDSQLIRKLTTDDGNYDDIEASVVTDENDSDTKKATGIIVPVNQSDILGAVQDLLQSAGMALNDDARDVMESNLVLRDQLSHKDANIESLLNQGKNLSNDLSTAMDAFLCPITQEVMTDPVICADGHTYERPAIETWLRSNSRSPKTNQTLASRMLIPNHALRNAIDNMTESLKNMKNFSETFG